MPDGTRTHPWLRGPVPYPLGHWGFMFLQSEAKFALSAYVTKCYNVYLYTGLKTTTLA